MKKVVIFWVVVLFVGSCTGSKSYSSEALPTEVKQWVESHLAEIKQIREHWKSSIQNIQEEKRAEFTSYQQQLLWVGKILEVLELDWTEQERRYIESILELIVLNPVIFSNDEDYYESDSYSEWAEKGEELEDYASNELGWDRELIWNLFYTLAPLLENKQIEPKRDQWFFKETDSIPIPYVVIEGILVPYDSIK